VDAACRTPFRGDVDTLVAERDQRVAVLDAPVDAELREELPLELEEPGRVEVQAPDAVERIRVSRRPALDQLPA